METVLIAEMHVCYTDHILYTKAEKNEKNSLFFASFKFLEWFVRWSCDGYLAEIWQPWRQMLNRTHLMSSH